MCHNITAYVFILVDGRYLVFAKMFSCDLVVVKTLIATEKSAQNDNKLFT